MLVKINKSDFEKNYYKIDADTDHYDLLADVTDYLVEYEGYDHLKIGDNTDFEIVDGEIVVDLELL
jgi:hypothetical protein